MGQVVRALEGPVRIVSCMVDDHCPQYSRCNLRLPVQKIQASISSLLDTMTLAELTRGRAAVGHDGGAGVGADNGELSPEETESYGVEAAHLHG